MAVTDLGNTVPAATDTLRLRVNVIDALMAAKGITTVLAQAEAFGINRSFYYDLRNGVTVPNLRTAMRMATVANTHVEALFGWGPE